MDMKRQIFKTIAACIFLLGVINIGMSSSTKNTYDILMGISLTLNAIFVEISTRK